MAQPSRSFEETFLRDPSRPIVSRPLHPPTVEVFFRLRPEEEVEVELIKDLYSLGKLGRLKVEIKKQIDGEARRDCRIGDLHGLQPLKPRGSSNAFRLRNGLVKLSLVGGNDS